MVHARYSLGHTGQLGTSAIIQDDTKKHNETLSLPTDDGNDDYDEDVEGDDNAENDIVCVTIVSEV